MIGLKIEMFDKTMNHDIWLKLNSFYIYERETWIFVHNGIP